MPQSLYQSSPNTSMGCCVLPLPFPQPRSFAGQYLSHPQQIRSGKAGLIGNFFAKICYTSSASSGLYTCDSVVCCNRVIPMVAPGNSWQQRRILYFRARTVRSIISEGSPDAAQRNPGQVGCSIRPGFHCISSGLHVPGPAQRVYSSGGMARGRVPSFELSAPPLSAKARLEVSPGLSQPRLASSRLTPSLYAYLAGLSVHSI